MYKKLNNKAGTLKCALWILGHIERRGCEERALRELQGSYDLSLSLAGWLAGARVVEFGQTR